MGQWGNAGYERMLQPIVRAVVFDFDGVLADTEGLHLRTFQDVFSELGWTLDRAGTTIAIWATTTTIW